MVVCGICASAISGDGFACDGVCGKHFHMACLKRGSRSSGLTTCAECADIKPCHILRLVRGITEALSGDLALVADRVNSFSSRWSALQLISDDVGSLNSKADRLLDVARILESNSVALLEKCHELASRVLSISGSLDDVRLVIAGIDPGVTQSASPILPIIDDIRRSVKQVKGDLGSWSAAISANSDLLVSIASEVRALSTREEPSSAPLASGSAAAECRDATCSGGVADPPSSLLRDDTPPGSDRILRRSVRRPRAARGRERRQKAPRGSPTTSGTLGGDSTHRSVAAAEGAGSAESGEPISLPCDGTVQANVNADNFISGDDIITLSAIPRPKSIFVTRLTPDTSCDAILRFIHSKGIDTSRLQCRKISGASKPYASFLLSTPAPHDATVLLSNNFWPEDVFCKIFTPNSRRPKNVAAVESPFLKNGVPSPSTIKM